MKDFLNKLRKNKIHISLENENLKIKYNDKISNDILEELKARKEEIISFLKNSNQFKSVVVIPNVIKQKSYQISSLQQPIWSVSQLSKGSSAYNILEIFNLNGKINKNNFELSLIETVKRHEVLRTIFKKNELGDVRQFILKEDESKFKLNFQDVREQNNAEGNIKDILTAEIDYSFDLSTDSLFRCSLIQKNSDEYILCVNIHHIICDGWSINLLINEVLSNYKVLNQNNKLSLEPLRIQYKDYSEWQQNNLKNGYFEKHKLYWTSKFADFSTHLELPSFKQRPKIKTYNGKKIKYQFSEDISSRLFNITKNNSTTLFSSLVSVVYLLLYKYTNNNDITIGTVTAGRVNQDVENQIGIYVNTLALRTKFEKNNNFNDLLKNVTTTLFEAIEYQEYPFNELINDLKLKRDISRSPLFDVVVVLQNQNKIFSNESVLDGLKVSKNNNFQKESSKHDLNFEFFESKNSIELELEFNTDIYDALFIERMFVHFENLLAQCIEGQDKAIGSIDY
ncbi:condensation domain-containing protein, partial [Flavobacterium sp. HJSW_4]|uniref:condensation domain-containing protein n=1 Tax=Flavobacterium sp. HJSW_4 TaxID=3344660 RepID=UPI0035F4372B